MLMQKVLYGLIWGNKLMVKGRILVVKEIIYIFFVEFFFCIKFFKFSVIG